MGLVEWHYPHSGYIVRSDNAWYATGAMSGDNYDINKCTIEAGYYDTPERVIPAINNTSKAASGEKNVTLTYSKITHKNDGRPSSG